MKRAILTVSALFCATLSAQTKRAVIVGIDEYLTPGKVAGYQPSAMTLKRLSAVKGKPSRDSLPTLDGAYNDAVQMKAMLIARFGFKESDIVMLPNDRQKATAENILGELQKHLIDEAHQNDISFFYYAGHGSRILNSLTTNVGGLDSTIIPQDALLGVPDIRSKELARIYAQAPVKGIHLTVIQDSCFSGGGARGPFGATKTRAQPVDDKVSVAEKFEGDLPEDRGVLILSASQDYQPAQEIASSDLGGAHGAFTWALLHVLGSSSPNERVDRIFQRTRALMQSRVDGQEPTMLAKHGHNEMGLFGQPADSFLAATAAVTSVSRSTGEIQIAGGRAMNLYPGCELKRIVPESPAVEIKVSQVTGLSSSKAVASESGTAETVKAGDLFQLDRWVVPDSESLRVYMGPQVSMDAIRPLLTAIADLRKRPDLEWIDDPTQKTPTHLISWDAGASQWTVRANLPGAAVIKVDNLSADGIAAALGRVGEKAAGKPRVYALIPAVPALSSRIQIGKNSVNPAILVVDSPQTAEYVLLGRATGVGVEYAWGVPGTTEEDLQKQFAAAQANAMPPAISAWPLRTNWFAAEDVEAAGKSLTDSALKLASIAGWLKLDSPKFETDFPYHLVLRQTGKTRDVQGGDVYDQEQYKLYLEADSLEAGRAVQQRRIYIFGVDSDGNGQLLFGSGNVANKFPRDPQSPDAAIALTGIDADIMISEPFGIDTYLLVATAQPIDDPESIFTFKGVRARSADGGSRGVGNPLERLLRSTGAGTRGVTPAVPTDWSVRRMILRSLPARHQVHIVSIGIDHYAEQGSLPGRKYGVADARAIGAAFTKAMDSRSFYDAPATYLLDRDATLEATRDALQKLAAESSPEDLVVFYFSGHGRVAGAQEEYYFALADATWPAPPAVPKGALSTFELSLLLRQVPARRQMVILDSDQSADALEAVHQDLNADPVATLKSTGRRFALLGLAGSTAASEASTELGHGLMAYALLKGLGGEADADHDGVISESELEGYLTWKIPSINNAIVKSGADLQLASYSNLRNLEAFVSEPLSPGERDVAIEEPEKEATPSDIRGKDYALIVAGDTYQNWPKLNNPMFDAKVLEEELEKNFGYQVSVLPNPTKEQLFGELDKLQNRQYSKNDRLLVYVAGHGDFNPASKVGYLVAADSKAPEADPHRFTYTSLADLRDIIDSLPVEHVLVVLDACYGGTFDHSIAVSGKRGSEVDNPISKDQLIKRKLNARSRLYLTSGGVRSVSDGVPGEHSPFARTFLKILRGYGGDRGVIDMDEIRLKMSTLSPLPMEGPFDPQNFDGDFIFIAKDNASPVPDPSLR